MPWRDRRLGIRTAPVLAGPPGLETRRPTDGWRDMTRTRGAHRPPYGGECRERRNEAPTSVRKENRGDGPVAPRCRWREDPVRRGWTRRKRNRGPDEPMAGERARLPKGVGPAGRAVSPRGHRPSWFWPV